MTRTKSKAKKMAAGRLFLTTEDKDEVLHRMSIIENDEEKNAIWQQLKTKLHSTMVAFGSESVQLPKLMDMFRNDWGSELTSFAVKLGFGCNDASVFKMLLTMPSEIESGFVSSTGTFAFKVIPKAETSENLQKIDQSNQYQNEMKKMFARRRVSMNNANAFHRPNYFNHAPAFARPPPPSSFNHSFPAQPMVKPSPQLPPARPPSLMMSGGSNPNVSRFPGLIIQLPNRADAQRRVSLTNGFHQPFHFANYSNAQPSSKPVPFALSSPTPKPSSTPGPSLLHKQIKQILISARDQKASFFGHPPIVRKLSNRLRGQVEQKEEPRQDPQPPQQTPNVKDEWTVTIAQLVEHFKQLKLSD